MTHFRLFCFMLLGYILFVGCTEEESLHTDENTAKTYLRIFIPRTDIKSRTIGTPTIPGTQEENAISDVTIFLTNETRIVKIDNVGVQSTAGSYISELIPVDVDLLDQEYQLFVVANPKKAGFDVRTTKDFKELYSTQMDTHKLVTLGQMVMSNQVEQTPAPTIFITKENTKSNPARATVYLDRLAVKIEPQVSENFQANFDNRPKENAFFENYTFTVKAAGLLNAATEFNLEQLWGKDPETQLTQLLSPTRYYKPEEQYFDRYYNTIKDYADAASAPFVPISESITDGYHLITTPLYCLENNSPFYDYTGSVITPENQVKTKYKGLTTGVIFKIQALNNNKAGDFYQYRGKYYTDSAADKQALATAAGVNIKDFDNPSLLRQNDIKVYEDGYIYYTYWIKDKNTAYSGEDYDLNYAIVRNSYYKLKLNSLIDIGDDIPGGGYSPDEPIDKIEQFELVAVCQDWTLISVTHDFE